jgi:arsenate reductase (thioredoxin)
MGALAVRGEMDTEKKRVLFLCTGNSARSQMAEEILRHFGGDTFDVSSAGTHPKAIHPLAIQAMSEIGIDVSRQFSKSSNTFLDQKFDYVITVCDWAREECPIFPRASHQIHWSFEDPAEAQGDTEQKLDVFRKVRDEILHGIRLLLAHSI